MVDIRGVNGGMNMDSAIELLRQGEYSYAMNVSVGSEGMVNLLGNRPASLLPATTNGGTEWICGSFFDKVRQRIIFFTNHSLGNHRIISYDVPSVSKPNGSYLVLFEDLNGVFDYWKIYNSYNPLGVIKDIRVIHREYEGDLYYFIDPEKKLRKFNYNTLQFFKSGDTSLCARGWTYSNYDGVTFRDGTVIPQITDNATWETLTTPAWCYYRNDPNNDSIYGKLYNWYAINDPRGFAPVGYRVPTDTDWTNLINCLGGSSIAGGKLKSTSNRWDSPNRDATNESLFNGLPGGFRNDVGLFNFVNGYGYWWTSTEASAFKSWSRILGFNSGAVGRENYFKTYGLSVRLIKET